MSISGISGGGYGYGYSSTINNLLQLSSLKTTSSYSAVQAANKISSTSSNTSAYSSVTSFLKDYQSELTGLEAAAAKLQFGSSSNVFSTLEAGSTDESVATASRTWSLNASTDINLEVHATAQAQKNVSEAQYATDLAQEDMEFEISSAKGTQKVTISSTNENGTKKTYNQMYQEAAKAINAGSKDGAGVRASVEKKDGKVSLALTGKETGEANGFSVSGNLGAAAGLDSVVNNAQDALYTVTQDGMTQSYSSSTNKVSIDYGRIEVELKKEGSTNIYAGVDADKIASAVEDLVDSYNKVTNLLESNSGRGAGTAAHLASFQRGLAGEKTLAYLGITTNKSGDLVVDRDKLISAMEKDFDFVADTLGGQFGLAEKAAQKADQALSDSVQRIVSNDLGGGSTSKSSGSSANANASASSLMGNQFTYFANFAAGGAYNLTNYYAVGMLLNTYA